MIPLGVKARDKITGFTGIVICRAYYLTGCTRYGVRPLVGDDMKIREAEWFDEPILEILDSEPVFQNPAETPAGPGAG